MLETILLALIIGKIKGYKIKPLFKSWTIYPILAFELAYLFIQANIFKENYNFIKYANTLETFYLCSYLGLIIKYEEYISAILGSVCIFIGTMLNKIAISANNAKMPVFPTLSYLTGYAKPDAFMKVDDIHILGSSSTKLKFLTDVIDVGYSILSIGDIFIRLFVFIIIFNTIRHMNRTECVNV
ncbi:DUF5317 family protein [uncultured Clostridium sp.]|uniref:DUF5317 family protein n=1 Tax=uncultured Clostridium sp. TaxID=59620 RepID=UPI0028E3054C|nr:DUF5317 family protein [uncultured Clostridium sp.]